MADPQPFRIGVIGTGYSLTGGSVPPPLIAAIARPPFAPFLIETRGSLFPDSPAACLAVGAAYVETGLRAVAGGAVALFVNTVGDYGLDALRSAVRVPVVGAGEAGIGLARQLARRFAIVTIWPPSLNFIFAERLRATGAEAACTGVRHVLVQDEMQLGTPGNAVDQMRAGQQAMIDRIIAACAAARDADGAEAILLGCTCMAPIAGKIAAALDIPVIEPMLAGYTQAERLLALSLTQSARCWPPAGAAALAALTGLPPGDTAGADGCTPCAIATAAE